MGPYEDLFREQTGITPLGEDFETRVFGKIRRKKRQRRQLTGAAFVLAFVLGLGIWFLLPSSSQSARLSPGPMLAAGEGMEEIPLLEEVTLSASGPQVEYPLELVSLSAREGGM